MNLKTPDISVVIPAFNAEKTIEETVKSVLNQTFRDFEIIIVNDGSTDETLNIISRFLDSRVKILTQENSGPQKSRNLGIKESVGRYIAFLDADDLWTSDKLELQLQMLEKYPESSVVYSWTNVIDEDNQVFRRGGYFTRRGNVFLDLLLINFIESGSNPLIRSEVIKEVGGFDDEIVAGQDWDMWLSLAENHAFEVVPKVQVLYRKKQNLESWSGNIERQERGVRQVLEKHLLSKKLPLEYQRACIANSYKYLLFECLQKSIVKSNIFCSSRFLFVALINDFSLIRKRVLIKLILRILFSSFLPFKVKSILFNQYPYFFDVTTLMGYFQVNVPSSLLAKT
jgi:glycosyltransferase involved in cell wall biosynthesis